MVLTAHASSSAPPADHLQHAGAALARRQGRKPQVSVTSPQPTPHPAVPLTPLLCL